MSSDPKDYLKEFENSLMYKYVNYHILWIIRLKITLPPGPEATTNMIKGGTEMKIISIKKDNKEKERGNIKL